MWKGMNGVPEDYTAYVENMIPTRDPLLAEMEAYAADHHIPIIELTGSEVLLSLLSLQRPKRILELGTAIGYSAIRMAKALPDAHITTVERNPKRYAEAKEFISRSDFADRIDRPQAVEHDLLVECDHLGFYRVGTCRSRSRLNGEGNQGSACRTPHQ